MPPVPFGPSKNMKKKNQQPLKRFDPGTPASNAVDITTTLQYLLTGRTQVNILWVALYYILGNCKQNITWLSLFVGTIVLELFSQVSNSLMIVYVYKNVIELIREYDLFGFYLANGFFLMLLRYSLIVCLYKLHVTLVSGVLVCAY